MSHDTTPDVDEAVAELRDKVQLLWHSIDELREALKYTVNNHQPLAAAAALQPPTSIPADPNAVDFGQRINRLTAADLPSDDGTHQESASLAMHRELWQPPQEIPDAAELERRILDYLADHTGQVTEAQLRMIVDASHATDDSSSDVLFNSVVADLESCAQIIRSRTDAGEVFFSIRGDDRFEPASGPAAEPQQIEHCSREGEGRAVQVDPTQLIVLQFDDGDVALFMPDGTWLATEENRQQAVEEAELKIVAYQNGTRWAIEEIDTGRGHLQKHFPEIARRYGLGKSKIVSAS